MKRTLAACLTVSGLLLATCSNNVTLAAIGVLLLALGAAVVLRQPETVD